MAIPDLRGKGIYGETIRIRIGLKLSNEILHAPVWSGRRAPNAIAVRNRS